MPPRTKTVVDPRHEVLSGMACVDTSGNGRLPILMQMVGALSRATDPASVLREFSAGMSKLEERPGYVSLSTRGLAPGQYRITRLITTELDGRIADPDPWRHAGELPIHESGFFQAIIRQAYPEIVHNFFLRDDPVVGDALQHFGSLMAIPLFDDGEPLNWAIMLHTEPEHYTARDLEEGILRANLVGLTVRNVLTAQKLREASATVRREVEQIARIQRSLLPTPIPDIPGLAIGASYETFDTAGGDLYDLAPMRFTGRPPVADPDGPWAILIADASGHGPAAATVIAMLSGILRASRDEHASPGELLAFANRQLLAKHIDGSFVTAMLARYDPTTRLLTYARAGHNPALLMRPSDGAPEITRLDAVGSVPLGVLDDVAYETTTLQLRPRQTVVLYTDGITEARAPDGTMFGVDGIERSLTTCSGEPDCAISHIRQALADHEAGTRPADDQTVVVMRVL